LQNDNKLTTCDDLSELIKSANKQRATITPHAVQSSSLDATNSKATRGVSTPDGDDMHCPFFVQRFSFCHEHNRNCLLLSLLAPILRDSYFHYIISVSLLARRQGINVFLQQVSVGGSIN